MHLTAIKTTLNQILPLREIFLAENNFQIRYNACHERNWTDSYLLQADGMTIGYGSVKGKDEIIHRDAIFEFFVLPSFVKVASLLFRELLIVSQAGFIECQTNQKLMYAMTMEFGEYLYSDTILFKDDHATALSMTGFIFRQKRADDIIFKHQAEPEGEWVLEKNGDVIATGGFLLHYNKPYADVYMEVMPEWRQRGLGTYFVQEVKKACYLAGRIPAARTGMDNIASRNTLLNAGMAIAGHMLTGSSRRPQSTKK
jgi:GNAT superfamily N-acetyltransferase